MASAANRWSSRGIIQSIEELCTEPGHTRLALERPVAGAAWVAVGTR